MHGEAARWQKRLRQELGDPRLHVRWNEQLERFQVGQTVESVCTDQVEWFYTVTDGNGGFRGMGPWVIRKLHTLDKKHQPNWTPARYRAWLEQEARDVDEKRREEFRYELMHEVKFASGRFWRVNPQMGA